ncbi:hypothetical protein H4S02_010134, partial [Coemansia sp. RSA 2611]
RLVEYPKDAKPEPIRADHDAGTKMEDAEPEGQAPKVDEPTDDEDDEGSSDAAEKAKKRQIKWAELPQPVRVIWPGTRVTRDLRPNRLNVICTADDLITKTIGKWMSGVNIGDDKSNVLSVLSAYSPVVEDKKVMISCPRNTSSYLYVTFDDNYKVSNKGVSGA